MQSPHSHLFLVSYTSTDAREWEHESCTGSTLQPELTEFSYTLHTYIHTSNTNANTQTVSLCIGPSKHRTYQVLPSVSLATLRQVIPASCAALFLIDESWCSHTYVCTPAVLFSVLYMYGTICVTVRGTSSHVQRLERTLFVSRE